MSIDLSPTAAPVHSAVGVAEPTPPLRVWPALVLVGLYWASYLILGWADLAMFTRFIAGLAACALLTLLFTVWWWLNRRLSRSDRLLGFGVAVAGGILAALLSPTPVGGPPWLMLTLPVVVTAWTLCLVAVRKASAGARRLGLLATLALAWGAFLLVRMEGLTGSGRSVLRWRWAPTAEELYLAERAREGTPSAQAGNSSAAAIELRPGDWPGFRGPGRDAVVRGARIATDWGAAPPSRPLWKRRIGPAWSSVAVVGERLFTQEQRGTVEAVVCLDARTGREIWSHQDAGRFEDGQAGPGPRATPTFHGGRVYALGATGTLNCLDAATGARKWSRNIAADAGAKAPLWGFSSSPLVVGPVVIVFAGGDGSKSLLAYRTDSGDPAWTAPAGTHSYSSPQLASLGGEDQVLFFGDRGLVAVNPVSGAVLWQGSVPGSGMPRSLQPRLVGNNQILLGSGSDFGTALLEVKRDGKTWSVTERWTSRRVKPSFNDFVVHDGFAYGFDNNVFCCLDLQTGQRRWKEGRYDHGQVLLLAEQGLLLVVSEMGEAILLAARPDRHEELGRFQAINERQVEHEKTWNHPVVAHGRLYVRNATEIACFELPPPKTR
jgi:outer membrane protein assembly factor BamB